MELKDLRKNLKTMSTEELQEILSGYRYNVRQPPAPKKSSGGKKKAAKKKEVDVSSLLGDIFSADEIEAIKNAK